MQAKQQTHADSGSQPDTIPMTCRINGKQPPQGTQRMRELTEAELCLELQGIIGVRCSGVHAAAGRENPGRVQAMSISPICGDEPLASFR